MPDLPKCESVIMQSLFPRWRCLGCGRTVVLEQEHKTISCPHCLPPGGKGDPTPDCPVCLGAGMPEAGRLSAYRARRPDGG